MRVGLQYFISEKSKADYDLRNAVKDQRARVCSVTQVLYKTNTHITRGRTNEHPFLLHIYVVFKGLSKFVPKIRRIHYTTICVWCVVHYS